MMKSSIGGSLLLLAGVMKLSSVVASDVPMNISVRAAFAANYLETKALFVQIKIFKSEFCLTS